MKPAPSNPRLPSTAPAVLGAVFLVAGCWITGCDKPASGNSASGDDQTQASRAETTAPPAESFAPVAKPLAEPPDATPQRLGGRPRTDGRPGTPPASATNPDAPATLRFVAYNLENWLTMDRYSEGRKLPSRPKPDEEKEAVVATVAAAKPDVLGVCEIGTREDLMDLQSRLAAAGCNLPHLHHSGGEDEVRHLGLLSRLPITATGKPADDDYQLDGRTFRIQRGILDATIQAGDRSYRFLGAHFKSKRDVEEGDQEEMRRNEAHLMRSHIEDILKADPGISLVAYGDLNDTRRSAAVRALQGAYNSPGFLTAVRAADSRGHVWTHHWEYEDVYSRFDYILINNPARQDLDFEASRILDPENWDQASDHRALLVVFH